MNLAMMVVPLTDENLARAAQVGVSEIVLPYPGPKLADFLEAKKRIENAGLRLTHIERKIPHLRLVHRASGWQDELDGFRRLVGNMADAGLTVLCYNWMPDEDWQRTTSEAAERGGSKVTAFRMGDVGAARNVTDADGQLAGVTSAAALWESLERFLHEIVPVAEDAGIRLALHPDDPPLPELRGQPRIITSVDALQRACDMAPSPANGVCFCVGTLGLFGQDEVIDGIRRLRSTIAFAHLRNVRGSPEDFTETWHDNGQLDMAEIVRTLLDVGFDGAARPDHAPSMAGEPNDTPGYEMLGRLFAAGYLRGLMHSAAPRPN